MKGQEEEARLLAQTFIPSALSRCNYIRQKYEKYATHSQKTHISSNKLDKYTTHNAQIVQTRKVNKTKRRVDECQSAKIC